jgi:hypothetical protein
MAFAFHDLLYRTGKHSFEQSVREAQRLAEAVWYQGYCPTLADLNGVQRRLERQQFQRVLCALELISQYPVCQRRAARHIQVLTEQFHMALLGPDTRPTRGRYSPSKRWRLNEKTGPLRKALLPLQTRTYADTTGRTHGFNAWL